MAAPWQNGQGGINPFRYFGGLPTPRKTFTLVYYSFIKKSGCLYN